MEIDINERTLLSDIRKAFKMEFPFLDLAFFGKAHSEGTANTKATQYEYGLAANIAGDPHREGLLKISGSYTVAEVEALFESQFGLHAQILRKSGNLYLQTTTSDSVSLMDLNQSSKDAAEYEIEKPEAGDYHEQE